MALVTSFPQPVDAISPARTRAAHPTLSVVVVNYRQWEKTGELLGQLARAEAVRHGQAEIVVVDNHSPPHRLVKRLRRQPGVSLRRWNKNHGFARAVNEGCRLSRGKWFLLLNPDLTLADDFLDRVQALADHLVQNEPKTGIVGFHLRNPDGTRQLSTGAFPTFLGTLARLVRPRSRRKYQDPRTPQRCSVSWVTGCCLLARRECLDDLGGLDEDFFLYYEDVDLCLRARARGWNVAFEPALAVVHHHPLHARTVPALLRLVTRHSLLTYARKHWRPWQARLLGQLVRCEANLRRAWSWWRGDFRQADIFRDLARLTDDLRSGRPAEARCRLENAVQRVDLRVGV